MHPRHFKSKKKKTSKKARRGIILLNSHNGVKVFMKLKFKARFNKKKFYKLMERFGLVGKCVKTFSFFI